MSWRTVVITGNAKLDYKLGYLVVRKQSEIKQVHLSEIETLIVESTAVSLTSMLLCELVKNKVGIVFCDNKHNPMSELLALYGSHDNSAKIRNQIGFKADIKSRIWTRIVYEKISRQSELLEKENHLKEAVMLQQYLNELEVDDITNREGHAAKVYFNALFGKVFIRGEPTAINAALDYGYSVILSYFNREIVANGYLTQLGLFHDNIFNPFNLSSDLMEPYRILVDREVVGMDLDQFETEEKHLLLRLFDNNVKINGQYQSIMNSIKIYVQSIFTALRESDDQLVSFYEL